MNGSKKEWKEVLLEEYDLIWVELCDFFIVDVCNFRFFGFFEIVWFFWGVCKW